MTPFVQFIEFHPRINILNQYFVLYRMATPSPVLGTKINTSSIMVRCVSTRKGASDIYSVLKPVIVKSRYWRSDNKFGKNQANKNTARRIITDLPRGQEDD
jgi:hypothetical protein